MVGVYTGKEVMGPHGVEPRKAVAVHLSRPARDVVLVLAAYDPVDWTVTVERGTRLARVILSGYHAQRATVPAGVTLDIYGYDDKRPLPGRAAYGYEWPSVDADLLVRQSQAMTNLPLASFRGCYESSHFAIGDESPTPESRTSGAPLAKCAAVLSEQRRCVALAGHPVQVVAVGLDSGTSCLGPSVAGAPLEGNASLGWIGNRIYACVRERGVVEIGMADGAMRVAPVGCEAVTSVGNSLLVRPSHEEHGLGPIVRRYASFDDLLAGNVAEELAASNHASRIAARGRNGYYAWHSTDEIQVVPLVKGGTPAPVTRIKLEKYDDWIFGLDALSDGTLVIGSPSRTARDIRLFDGTTGAQLRSIQLAPGHRDISGLKCQEP